MQNTNPEYTTIVNISLNLSDVDNSSKQDINPSEIQCKNLPIQCGYLEQKSFNWKIALKTLGLLVAVSLISIALLTAFSIVPVIPVIGLPAAIAIYSAAAIAFGAVSLHGIFKNNDTKKSDSRKLGNGAENNSDSKKSSIIDLQLSTYN